MFRRYKDKVYGVLYDFDLSAFRHELGPASKRRTGTKPFMAIDLLGDQMCQHLYRHDLESLFYVLVWITSRYHEGQLIRNPPLQEWEDKGGEELRKEKLGFLSQPLLYHFKPLFI
jgi:Fungal protein kinase